MNAIELLKSQHREVEMLFKQIEGLTRKASKEKKQLFSEIARKREIHAKIEEKIFYPEGEEVDKDITLEAYEEHDVVRVLMKKISKTLPGDETYMAKITVLKEMVQRHVKEEESEYFPECKMSLGDEKMEELGVALESETEKIESKYPKSKLAKHLKKSSA